MMIINVCIQLQNWFKQNNYSGTDPYLLDQTINKTASWIPFFKQIRRLLKPLHSVIPSFLFSKKQLKYPIVHGFSIEANALLFTITKENQYLTEAEKLLDELIDLSISKDEIAWGLPFQWGGEITYPINTPFAINQALISLSLKTFYDISQDIKIKETIIRSNDYIINKIGFTKIHENCLGIHYSSIDNMLAYNISAVCAESLLMTWELTSNESYYNVAKQALNFVKLKQRFDGAWEYGESNSLSHSTIDNRHTCYILGSLIRIQKKYPEFELDNCIQKGTDYYLTNLLNGFLPKWDDKNTYPIDISDVGMSIILLIELNKLDLAQQLINFSIEKMSNGKDQFYFKYFENDKANRTVFIRWGQAWMFKALTKFEYASQSI